jgi:SAM-dependent methyltransferase
VGAVGQGTGALSCYAQPHHGRWVFYEIDREVDHIARDPQWFTYLQNARRPVETLIGDARVSLARPGQGPFDVLILDAYSADSIPLHLLTREALGLYGAKLKPGGILLFHLSNRYFDLAPILSALAQDGGWHGRIRDDARLPESALRQGRTESRWAVLARQPSDFAVLLGDSRWQPLPPPGPLWTDDRASAGHALRWDWLLGQ